MNKVFYLLLFLCFGLYAQRQPFRGQVVMGDATVPGVFVINKTTGAEAKTAAEGLFTIDAKIGDRLTVYNEGIAPRNFVVTGDAVGSQPYKMEVQPKTTELNEVVLDDKIDSKSTGVADPNQKQYTTAQNRKRANRTLRANQGLDISVDALANKLNGRSKTINQNVSTEEKITAVENFRIMYTPQEITDKFGIPEEHIEGFLYFSAEDPDCLAALIASSRTRAKPELQRLAPIYLERLENGE